MKQNWIIGILLAAGFLLLTAYGSAPLFLPKPAPASIPADRFSAERAMRHVQVLAKNPRMAGSPGMEQAATYVVGSLQNCGLNSEIQEFSSNLGMLRNVVAYLPGNQPGDVLLIVSHFDSVSYGAGDNASGAAVLLETACSLRAGKPLKNGLILLFEDGEEQGYLGGYAFTRADPSVSTIHRVIGLDTAAWGPVVLLQTTPGNGALIQAYAGAVKRPAAFGFFADADWSISRDTSEIQPFYERGIPGLELEDPTAFTGKHSATDTANQVKPGSLQQMGDQVLALARALGDSDLTRRSNSDLSYFTLWGFGLVHYPADWNLVFAILTAIGLSVMIVKVIRQKNLGGRAFFIASILLICTMIGAAVLGFLGSLVFAKLFPSPNPNTGSYLVPASLPFFLMVIAFVVAGYLVVRTKFSQRLGSPTLALAGLLFWSLLSVISALLLPVGSTIFTLPAMAAILTAFLPVRAWWARLLPAALATILFVPNIVLAFLGTGMETLILVTLLAAILAELWVALRSP